jgi:RHS repeat-associated protein
MSALAWTTEINCDTRAANEDCINGGSRTRTKYGYDAAGNTSGYSSDSFFYNQRGRMTSATVGSSSTNYIYSALGQMIEKSGPGGSTYLMYDEAGHLLGEYSSGGALIEETVWMGDTPIATLQSNGSSISTYYVHTDQLNAPRVITQPSTNTVAWRWDTDPFGTVTPNQNPSGLGTFSYNLRFPGQYYQAETGLNYNYFRDYDPQTGRYLESDPIGLFGGSYSTYAYANGNPISNFDPTGLASAADEARAFGLTTPPPAPRITPETKAYLCQLLNETNGQFQQAWILADAQRQTLWNDPVLRDAENWLYAAGWPGLQTTEQGIVLHQYLKLLPLGGTTPYSEEALLAGLEGRLHQNQPPADVLKSCNSCGSH